MILPRTPSRPGTSNFSRSKTPGTPDASITPGIYGSRSTPGTPTTARRISNTPTASSSPNIPPIRSQGTTRPHTAAILRGSGNPTSLTPKQSLTSHRPQTSGSQRLSNRDRLSLSRQLQYANANMIRPLSAVDVEKSPKKKSTPKKSFSKFAQERFKARKQKQSDLASSGPGMKKLSRLSNVQKGRDIVISGDRGDLKDGVVHLF